MLKVKVRVFNVVVFKNPVSINIWSKHAYNRFQAHKKFKFCVK